MYCPCDGDHGTFQKAIYLSGSNSLIIAHLIHTALADPGGHPRRAPPQQDPILSFLHMFSPKSVRVGGRRPPQRVGASPQREILDPPLM